MLLLLLRLVYNSVGWRKQQPLHKVTEMGADSWVGMFVAQHGTADHVRMASDV
mgnify:CR=1 FL=1